MAEVLRRALWSRVQVPDEGLLVPRGARRWRLATYEVEEVLADLRTRGVRYGAARAMLPQRLAHRILVKMELSGDSPDDRVQDAVARSREVKKYVDALWPAVDPARLVLSAARRRRHSRGRRRRPAQRRTSRPLLLWAKPPKAPTSARWSLADAVLIDEVADLVERTPSLGPRRGRRGPGPVGDDAARGRPPLLDRARRRCSATSPRPPRRGRAAPGRRPWATSARPTAHIEQLTLGFRVPGEVIEYAARLLPVIAPGLEPPRSVRRARGELDVRRVDGPRPAFVDGGRAAAAAGSARSA